MTFFPSTMGHNLPQRKLGRGEDVPVALIVDVEWCRSGQKLVRSQGTLQYLCEIYLEAGEPNVAPSALSGTMLLHTGADPALLSLGCAGPSCRIWSSSLGQSISAGLRWPTGVKRISTDLLWL